MLAARRNADERRPATRSGQWLGPQVRYLLRRRQIVLAALAVFALTATAADPLPPPQGDVLLRISGAIERPNVGDETHFDRAMLEALPRHSYETETPWDEGWHTFEGVLLRDVLDAVGARSATFEAIGRDDYRAMFDGIDIHQHAVMLAFRQNDKDLTIRTLGPLRIMFPFSEVPAFVNQSTMAAAVWQIVALDVQ